MKKLSRVINLSFLSLLLSAFAVQGLSNVAAAADEVVENVTEEPSPPQPAAEKNTPPAQPAVKQEQNNKDGNEESNTPEPAPEKNKNAVTKDEDGHLPELPVLEKNKKNAKPAAKKTQDKKAATKDENANLPELPALEKDKKIAKPAIKKPQAKKQATAESTPPEPAAEKNKKIAKPAIKKQQDKHSATPPTKARLTQEQAKQAIEKIAADMVAVNGGCFQMGSPEKERGRGMDEQQHQVCVEKFSIGKYEITQQQWQAVMEKNPAHFQGQNLPVENVSWKEVQDFIARLNAKTGKSYRLPTEAQWEYAARAGSTTAFYTGNCINPRQANYDGGEEYGNCGKSLFYNRQTVDAGSYQPNPLGLYDMAGNVWEWTCSAYIQHYDGNETKCSDDVKVLHVLRGGSWSFGAEGLRSANRTRGKADDRSLSVGFRLTGM